MKIGQSPKGKQGAALVLVLAFVALMSALLLAFLSTAQNSRRSAGRYEAEVDLAQLAETATNVVMGQIVDATRSWKVSPDNRPGSRLTYSTQPGLIRTYDSAGRADRAFKLYSSDSMVTSSGSEWVVKDQLAREVPEDWVSRSAEFVDLNAPVLVLDPNGDVVQNGQKFTANYPILDPSALSPSGRVAGASSPQDGVDGFDLFNVPGYGGPQSNGHPALQQKYNPTTVPSQGWTGNPAPMPARWLYVLQNGTITSPSSSTGTIASWADLPDDDPNKPTKANPIVGRIAFWTDDDTCKLNPNVHSEGIAWDTPWARSKNTNSPYAEDQLAERQPIREEYQRYPGHPATVCLSPVFGMLAPYRVPTGDTVSPADYVNSLTPYYNLTPRLGTGGSKGGTVQTNNTDIPASSMLRDSDRLFASVDELAFMPNRSATPLKKADLEKAKFFLTTQARAAEVNLFGQPRVSLWMPQQEQEPNASKHMGPARARTAKDELLAACGTIGGNPYYFQRFSIYLSDSVNNRRAHPDDPFMQLPKYGYFAPSSQWPSLDWDIPRNKELYRYLQQLTSTEVPGFGGKITDRYPAQQRNQILTEMLDLLRLTNSYAIDPTLTPNYQYVPPRVTTDNKWRVPSGETQVVPLSIGASDLLAANTKGFGRFPTVTEAMLIFYKSAPDRMRILLALEPYSAAAGSWDWSPLVRYVVKGLDKVRVNGESRSHFKDQLTNLVTARCGYKSGGNDPSIMRGSAHRCAHTGTYASFRYWKGDGQDGTKTIEPSGTETLDEEKDYSFVSDDIELPLGGDSFLFSTEGEITVEIHSGYATAATEETKIQTLHFRFPEVRLPVPNDAGDDSDFNNRIGDDKYNLVNPADVVRSVEVDPEGPSRGDLRLVAALRDVPSEYFAGLHGAAGYQSTERAVHSFRNGDGAKDAANMKSAILKDGGLANNIAARGMNGATMVGDIPGDWDNGQGPFMDGAYINQPADAYDSSSSNELALMTSTPNRQIASAVAFGSLPVLGVAGRPEPWRTLLFCPNPAAGKQHPALLGGTAQAGAQSPDHLFLDFFTMPIVEPYAISEPLSTMGKVNLNFQIAPYSYITRATALQGVLKSTRICAIPTGADHKNSSGKLYRLAIDANETLKGFAERFDSPSKGGAFRSASEICEMHLVPRGATLGAVRDGNWWDGYRYTGDNAREAPYGQIYARVTTKSNTFTVHSRVQTLRKHPGANWSEWREGVDHVIGEQRSSQTIERYVDLGDGALPDFAKDPNATLDRYYKFRIIQTKRFNP